MGEENILYVPNLLTTLEAEKRHNKIALNYFNSTPTIGNIYNGVIHWLKGHGVLEAEGTGLQTGVVPIPGMRNPKDIIKATLTSSKIARTLEDYLKTTKVFAPKLERTSALRSSYATDRFLGGLIFESSLPEEAMKVQGHGMAKSATILDALARLRYMLDNGFEKGKTFYTAPLKLSEEGKKFGTFLGTAGGTPYFDGHFLITGKPGLMINSIDDIGTIYINDAYENEEALRAALKLQLYLLNTYPKINFKLYSLGFKQGGKMNILQFLKNGSGIHIKKKNRGKFTDYCGGKVTSECIAKGKRSPNPAIRKRATFALNARRWKHKFGGIISKAANGDKSSNWILKANNWLNKNQNTISTIGDSLTSGMGLIKQNSELSSAKTAKETELNEKYNPNNFIDDSAIWGEVDKLLSALKQQNPDVNYGDIDRQNLYLKLRLQALANVGLYAKMAKAKELQEYNLQIENILTGNTASLMELIGNGISTGLGMLGKTKLESSKNSLSSVTLADITPKPSYLLTPKLSQPKVTLPGNLIAKNVLNFKF